MAKDLRADRRMKGGNSGGKFSRFFAERNARAEGRRRIAFEDEAGVIASDIRGGRRFLPFLCTGLAIGIFGGVVWYAYGGLYHKQIGALPVVAAESGEIKVRPLEEGGLEIPHRDKAVLNPDLSVAEAQTVEHLLPLPEEPEPRPAMASEPVWESAQPAPEAQVAEVELAAPVAQPEVPHAGDMSREDSASPEPTIDDVIAAIGSKPALETAAPGKAEEASAEETQTVQLPTESGYFLQLAAVQDKSNIEREWGRLKKTFPDLLGDQKLVIEETDVSGKTYYRIQTGPFPTKATAEDVCAQLKTKKQPCILKRKSD